MHSFLVHRTVELPKHSSCASSSWAAEVVRCRQSAVGRHAGSGVDWCNCKAHIMNSELMVSEPNPRWHSATLPTEAERLRVPWQAQHAGPHSFCVHRTVELP
jgi:hypothetical protein